MKYSATSGSFFQPRIFTDETRIFLLAGFMMSKTSILNKFFFCLCFIISWLCPFGLLLSYFVAAHIMGMSAFSPVIDLGPFLHDLIGPLIWPMIIGGLAAPLLGVMTSAIYLLLKTKPNKSIYFPFAICLMELIVLGFLVFGMTY